MSTALVFTKATKLAARLRMALIGPAGCGKTYTALTIAKHLGGRVAVIDTEHGSASKYADLFEFDVLELDTFAPQTYASAIKAAEAAGYAVVIVDSLSHAWVGKGGALDMHDNAVAKSKGNTFTAWRDVTPHHNALLESIVSSRCHVLATMRAKTEYVVEEGGKRVRKVGLAPVQRDGCEYEFDVVGDLDLENTLVISKTRCPALSGQVFRKPGKPLADILTAWLGDGAQPAPKPEPPPAPKPQNGHADPNLPKNGAELLARLTAYEAKLVAAGTCKPGELLQHVAEQGVAVFGYPENLAQWTGASLAKSVDLVKAFVALRSKSKPTQTDAAPDGVRFANVLREKGKQLHAENGCTNEDDLTEHMKAFGKAKGWGESIALWKGQALAEGDDEAWRWLAEKWEAVRAQSEPVEGEIVSA